MVEGREWIEALPASLERQAALLSRLLDLAEADRRFRAFEIQCSIARGAGDELSDLDFGYLLADDGFEETTAELPARLAELGPTVDLLASRLHGFPYLTSPGSVGLPTCASTNPA